MQRLAAIVLCFCCGVSCAAVIDVSPRSPKWKTINGAVNAARPGDVIRVHGGVYREAVRIADKPNLTLVGVGAPSDPAILEGADPLSPRRGARWTRVKEKVYSTPYKWRYPPLTDQAFTAYGGGRDLKRRVMTVYENDVSLRGYRNRHTKRSLPKAGDGGRPGRTYLGGPYAAVEELDPASSAGRLPPAYLKPDIRVPGRFLYDGGKGRLLVWPAAGDDPSKHEYAVPVIPCLVRVRRSPGVTLRGLVLRHAMGFAVQIEASDRVTVEDCFLPANHFGIRLHESSHCVVRRNFVQELGFWERHWYDDAKGTLLWGHAIEVSGWDKTRDIDIHHNVLSGGYSLVRTKGSGIRIHDNLISRSLSALINATDTRGAPKTFRYDLRIFNNVLHHGDMCGAVALSFVEHGPLSFYRNIVYRCRFGTKNGGQKPEQCSGEKRIYHNTFALIGSLVSNPYLYAPHKRDIYRNNVVLSRNWTRCSYLSYWRPDMRYFPFTTGPDMDGDLYWKAGGDTAVIGGFGRPGTPAGRRVYTKKRFRRMCDDLGLEPKGLQASPDFAAQRELMSVDPRDPGFDKLSLSDWRDVRRRGYAGCFEEQMAALRARFGLKPRSPAVNRGLPLPTTWPDLPVVKDGKPDIGAVERAPDGP